MGGGGGGGGGGLIPPDFKVHVLTYDKLLMDFTIILLFQTPPPQVKCLSDATSLGVQNGIQTIGGAITKSASIMPA